MMRSPWFFFALCLIFSTFHKPLPASEFDLDWSGHFRGNTSFEYYSEDHLLSEIRGDQLFLNGGLDGRLNSSLYWGERTSFNLAYELVLSGGQTREAVNEIAVLYPNFSETFLFQSGIPSDDNQLFSLTKVISEGEEYILYHRLDRLFLAYNSAIGNFSIGRQPLTWGNGLLFNPADLINPFAPSDIIRDYKIGSDMVLYQNGFDLLSDLQLVIVPRTGDDNELDSSQSTYGVKMRLSFEPGDLDVYALKNYKDPIVGAGGVTYLGDGVLRSDLSWTYLEEESEVQSFFSAVLNYDYSWNWFDKNWYGFVEFYYNGLGESDPLDALQNEALRERLARGEIFVTGRYYVDALLQYEAHPLVNIFSTLIYNLEDQSFLFQPRINWNISQSVDLLVGINIAVGSDGSEFGNLRNPEDGSEFGSPTQAYLVVTFFF